MNAEKTAFFVTCLVDQFFPAAGEASVRLLEQCHGCRVDFPPEQTCCGQPAFNMGYREEARRLARRFIEIFEPYDEIVAPAGSCVSAGVLTAADCGCLMHLGGALTRRRSRMKTLHILAPETETEEP